MLRNARFTCIASLLLTAGAIAQGDSPSGSFETSDFRGFVYLTSDARNSLDMWQRFNGSKIRNELRYASRIGFNFARIFIHNLAFEPSSLDDEQDFENSSFWKLEEFIRIAHEEGIPYVMPVIFDGCGFPFDTQLANCSALSWDPDRASGSAPCWLSSPGYKRQNNETYWPVLERYVKQLGAYFEISHRHQPTLWDLQNEPECAGKHLNWQFLRHFLNIFGEATSLPITYGAGIAESLAQQRDISLHPRLTHLSYHTYFATEAHGRQVMDWVTLTLPGILGFQDRHHMKPIFNSETGCYSLGSAYDETIRLHDEYSLGFTVWELMVSDCAECADKRRQRTGLVYPDGSIRDSSGVLAVRGFYPNVGRTKLSDSTSKNQYFSEISPPVLHNQFEKLSEQVRNQSVSFIALPEGVGNISQGLTCAEIIVNFVQGVEAAPTVWPLRAELLELQRRAGVDYGRRNKALHDRVPTSNFKLQLMSPSLDKFGLGVYFEQLVRATENSLQREHLYVNANIQVPADQALLADIKKFLRAGLRALSGVIDGQEKYPATCEFPQGITSGEDVTSIASFEI